jgi:hypothetical protein
VSLFVYPNSTLSSVELHFKLEDGLNKVMLIVSDETQGGFSIIK